MKLLEFTDAETGDEFIIPESRLIRVNKLKNENRCEVWYEEHKSGTVVSQIVHESWDAIKVKLSADG